MIDETTCAACGGELTVVNQVLRGNERMAVLSCSEGHQWEHQTFFRAFGRNVKLQNGEDADRLVEELRVKSAARDERRRQQRQAARAS